MKSEIQTLPFKKRYSLAERTEKYRKFSGKYPGKIPVVLERGKSGSGVLPEMRKCFYLFGADISCAQLMVFIRKQAQLSAEMGMWFFVDGTMPQLNTTMGRLWEERKEPDGFLYITYCGELTFGCS